MKIAILAVLAIAVIATHPVSQRLTDEINNSGASWVAMAPEDNPFSYITNEEIKAMMGTKLMSMPEIRPKFTVAQ
jgi:hypothetical protein